LEQVSQLASYYSPNPEFTIIGFIIYGLLMVGLAYELGRSLRYAKYARIVRLSFLVHGIGFLLGGIFRDDPSVADIMISPTGILHNVSIIIGCLALLFGMFTFARIVSYDAAWHRFAWLSFMILVVIIVMFLISQLPTVTRIAGLWQRLYGIPPLIWIELVSIKYLLNPVFDVSRNTVR
jgi:hypothetical protein